MQANWVFLGEGSMLRLSVSLDFIMDLVRDHTYTLLTYMNLPLYIYEFIFLRLN